METYFFEKKTLNCPLNFKNYFSQTYDYFSIKKVPL